MDLYDLYFLCGVLLIIASSSVVGDEGAEREHGHIKAIPQTNVKLFSPSDLGFRYDEQGQGIPAIKTKQDIQKAAKDAGITTTIVLIGHFAEFTLNTQ